MNTYNISYKLFPYPMEQDANGEIVGVKEGTKEVEAISEREAIAKAQETIGLYVMECVKSA